MKKVRVGFEARDEYLLRNGAILLEKQISSYQGKGKGGQPSKIFSAEDIKRATNNYDSNLIIGRSIACIYKGTLEDDRAVAIKTPYWLKHTDKVIDFFLNQVVITLQIYHKNVVKLFGCCLETQIPMLVFEFMSNGTLFDHLHGKGDVGPRWISWSNRLKIAADIGYALSYMHCAYSKPIVHRDVKSLNIFLDEDYTAKLSNFGLSVTILPGKTFLDVDQAEGSHGYIDPEFLETLHVTEKCDVYGFGVVLVEILTRKNPAQGLFTGKKSTHMIGLVEYFVGLMKEKGISQIVEGKILEEGNMEQIVAFAELASRCVREKGDERPTMQEVVQELWRIQKFVL